MAPIITKCGEDGYPDCPPQPAAFINGQPAYTTEEMRAHGLRSYQKGMKDAKALLDYKKNEGSL